MQSRIVLISDDVDFFEYIYSKLNLRKSDELFKFSFEDIPNKIHLLSTSVLIINSENSSQKTLELLRLTKNIPAIVFAFNDNDNLRLQVYTLGALAFLTPFTSDEEFWAITANALNIASMQMKYLQYREMLVKNNLILKNNEVFTDYINNGIFTFLNSLDVPWKDKNISQQLNLQYHGNISGKKETSPLVDSLIVENNLTDNSKTMLAMTIFSIYSNKWSRLYRILSLEYEPIENYNMIETENTTSTNKNTDTITTNTTNSNDVTETNTGTNTANDSENTTGKNVITDSRTITENNNVTNNNSLYGFNSVSGVNSDSQNGTETRNTTDGNTHNDDLKGTRTNEHSENINTSKVTAQKNDIKDVKDGTHTENGSQDRTLSRHGNIGVTTSQQMINSEIELWQWDFFSGVFKDIDKILTIQTY